MANGLGWIAIVRLGLVQTALGAIVVLTTSTLNRVMVVELSLPAMLPGALVGLHYAVQMSRPRWGFGSDVGGRRTPWIIGGMALLALGGTGAAGATAWMSVSPLAGMLAAVVAFLAIGVGVGAAGTSLLVLLATSIDPGRRAAAATIVWLMMIAGFAITAGVAGGLLDPFSPIRLVAVTASVSALSMVVTLASLWRLEPVAAGGPVTAGPVAAGPVPTAGAERPAFLPALADVWREPVVRRFAVFVFVSMLAYSGQDLILEPYAGLVFGFTPGQSTALSGLHHGGVFVGMVLVGTLCTLLGRPRAGGMAKWVVGGCLLSAASLAALAIGGSAAAWWPLELNVFVLGVGNGAFAVAAIGSMMAFAATGRASREGTRMGLFGASQAIAFGLGGFLGTVAVDAAHALIGSASMAYASVFAVEAALFVVAARLAVRVGRARGVPAGGASVPATVLGDGVMAGVAR